MIYVFHGDDSETSYQRLIQILELNAHSEKIHIAKNSKEDLLSHLKISSLIDQKRIIICENFLSAQNKIPEEILKPQDPKIDLIFWENKTLSDSKIIKLQKVAKIEYFKAKSQIFEFLDSIYPNSKRPLGYLLNLSTEKSLLYHVQNRLLLLTLSKLNISKDSAGKLAGRGLMDWQWQKLKRQSSKFSLVTLLAMFKATLRIDLIKKSGQTDVEDKTMLSMMFLKYL